MRELLLELPNLPTYVSTLKKQAKSYLPLLTMYIKKIPLHVAQQSDTSNKSKEDLILFDIVETFSAIVSSNIADSLHLDFG